MKAGATAQLIVRPSVNAAAVVSEYAKETFGELDMGGYRVRFAANNRKGSRYVDLGVVNDEGRLRF